MRIEKPELVNALATVLGDAVVFSYKLLGAHWNVEGPDFHQNHAFFQMLYEDVEGMIDPTAENIRKLGSPAPFRLSDLTGLSRIIESDAGSSFTALCIDAYEANEIILSDIGRAFDIATALDEQGMADFLAGRDDMHKKWRWQLSASMQMADEE